MELGSLCFPKTFHNVVKGFGEKQRTKFHPSLWTLITNSRYFTKFDNFLIYICSVNSALHNTQPSIRLSDSCRHTPLSSHLTLHLLSHSFGIFGIFGSFGIFARGFSPLFSFSPFACIVIFSAERSSKMTTSAILACSGTDLARYMPFPAQIIFACKNAPNCHFLKILVPLMYIWSRTYVGSTLIWCYTILSSCPAVAAIFPSARA